MTTDEITSAVEQIVRVKVAQALAPDGDVIGKIVGEVMNHRDNRGYGRKEEKTFLERTLHDSVASVVRVEVIKHIENSDEFRAKICEAVGKKAEAFATVIADAFVQDDWRASVNVTINRKDDDC